MKNLYVHFSASRRLKNKSSDQIILKAWYFPQNDTSSFLFKKNCLRVIRIWEILEQDSQGCFLYYCYIIFTSYHGCVLLQVVGMVTRKDIGRYRMWSHRGQIGLEEVHILEANSIHDSFWLFNILARADVPRDSHCGAVQDKKILHIRLILKLTYLKLFLDMALSFPRIILPHASWMFCVEDDDAC